MSDTGPSTLGTWLDVVCGDKTVLRPIQSFFGTWLYVLCGDKTALLPNQSFFHADMAYFANPHDIYLHQAAVIQQQALHIARLEQH